MHIRKILAILLVCFFSFNVLVLAEVVVEEQPIIPVVPTTPAVEEPVIPVVPTVEQPINTPVPSAKTISGTITLKNDISNISEITNLKIDILNSVGVVVLTLVPNEIVENNIIVIPDTKIDTLLDDTYKVKVSGDKYKESSSQTFTLPSLTNVVFVVTDFVQIPEKPHFKLPESTHSYSPITVTFSAVAKNITIYYTTDGSMPTTESKIYLDGIVLSESAVVKAIAVRDNASSNFVERAFTIEHLVSGRSNVTTEKPPINLNVQTPVSQKSSPVKSQIQAQPIAQVQQPIIPQTNKFSDVNGNWAKEYINELVSEGIINGYEDITFRPNDLITRAEAIKMIVSAIKLQPEQNVSLAFNDNSDIPSWSRGYIQIALQKGIAKGYDDNTFKALQSVSREELSVLAMRAFGLAEENNSSIEFADKDDVSNWAIGYMANAVGLGIITGYEDNTLKPNNLITRAETSAILIKCMHKIKLL